MLCSCAAYIFPSAKGLPKCEESFKSASADLLSGYMYMYSATPGLASVMRSLVIRKTQCLLLCSHDISEKFVICLWSSRCEVLCASSCVWAPWHKRFRERTRFTEFAPMKPSRLLDHRSAKYSNRLALLFDEEPHQMVAEGIDEHGHLFSH